MREMLTVWWWRKNEFRADLEKLKLKQLNILVWRLQYIVAFMFLKLALVLSAFKQKKNKLKTHNADKSPPKRWCLHQDKDRF